MTITAEDGTACLPSAPGPLDVLLIEDDAMFVDLTRLLLAHAGLASDRTLVAGSWREASEVLDSHRVDLVIADLTLPDASGLDIVHLCRQRCARTPIIVLTGCEDTRLAVECLANGAQDYLVKQDLGLHDLVRAVRYSLARASAEEQLRATLEQLESSNRQLEEYATIASHDLRSPVRTARVIVGRLGMVPALADDGVALDLVTSLDGCLGRLDAMLEGLLDYAQAGDVAASGERAALSLAETVAEIGADLSADLEAAGARIVAGPDVTITAHPVLFRRLLANVVQNAVKYRSTRPLVVEVTAEVHGDGSVQVSVTDNGRGIDPRFRARVFSMFERLGHGGEGIGLGLAVCHRIVSLHRGRIWIDDGVDGGVSVRWTFPP